MTPAALASAVAVSLVAGCAVKGATQEEKAIRMFLAPGSMGLTLLMPSEGWRGTRYYTYSRLLRNAAQRGDNAEAARCLTLGGDLNARDAEGWSALTLAVNEGHAHTAAFLVETKTFEYVRGATSIASNNLQPAIKDEALAIAVQRRNAEIVGMLLRNRTSPNSANDEGQTVLMRAANVGDAPIVRELLGAGADRNAKDKAGLTALDWARKSGCRECEELLR